MNVKQIIQWSIRTLIALSDVDCVSAKASDFVGTPPTWCKDPLPGRRSKH